MSYPGPPPHTPFQWHDRPATDTPLDAAHLDAAEVDLSDYTTAAVNDLAAFTDTTYIHQDGTGMPASVVSAADTGGPVVWATGTEFKVNELVSNSGTIYICTTEHTAGASFDSTKFQLILSGGVSAFNTRTGMVSLTKADVTGTGLAASDVGADAAGAAAAAQAAAITAAEAASAQRASNLSDLASASAARTNLGLGTAATQASTAFDAAGAASTAQSAAIAAAEAWASQGLKRTAVKSGAYTLAPGDIVPVDASGGAVPLTLPNAPADGARCAFKIILQAATPNPVTLAVSGADVFNKAAGSTSLSFAAINTCATAQYDAAAKVWTVTSTDAPLGVASGAAKLGTDGTVGGPGGSVVSTVNGLVPGDIVTHNAAEFAALAMNAADYPSPATVRANLGVQRVGTLNPAGLVSGNYTVQSTDISNVVQPGDNAAQQVIIPTGLGSITDSFWIFQGGTGPVTLVGAAGVTIQSFPAGAVQMPGQFSTCRLWQVLTNVWAVLDASSPLLVPGVAPAPPPAGSARVSGAYTTAITTDSPIAWWTLNDASGTTMVDQIRSPGHPGTYVASPTLGVTGLVGDSDKAVTLNGTSQYATVPYDAALNPAGAFSVEAWIKPSSLPSSDSGSVVNSRQPTTVGHRGFDLGIAITTGHPYFLIGNGTAYTTITASAAASTSTPTHLVGLWNGTSASLYVNGALAAGPTTVAYSPNATQALGVGAMISSPVGQFFPGTIDEAAIYSTALSTGRISAHYAAGTGGGGTTSAPTVVTGTASGTADTATTLNGTVNPNSQATTYYFDYGLTTGYGTQTTVTTAGSGATAASVSAALTGLAPNTIYHFRLVATNATGTSTGSDATVTTTNTGGGGTALPAATVYGGSHWYAAWVSKAPIAPADSPLSLPHHLSDYDFVQYDISNAPQSGGVPNTTTSWVHAVTSASSNPRGTKPICYITVTERYGNVDQFIPAWTQPATPWSTTVPWSTWTGQHNLLVNSTGVSITTTDTGRHLMDPFGTPTTSPWIDFVINHMIPWIMAAPPAGLGFGGVFIDNSWCDLATMSRAATSGSTSPINPRTNAIYTEQAWANDVKSFFSQVVAKVHATGGESWSPGVVIQNMLDSGNAYNANKAAFQTAVGAGMDSSVAEQWLTSGSTDPVGDTSWEYNVAMVEDLSGVTTALAANPGIYIIDRSAAYTLYSFASYLLGVSATQKRWAYAEDDHTGFIDYGISGRTSAVNPLQVNEYRPVRSYLTLPVGTPQERRQSPQAGLWKRQYDHGIVVVNSNSAGGSLTYSLGGTYTNQDGTTGVTSVTLAPLTGFIGTK